MQSFEDIRIFFETHPIIIAVIFAVVAFMFGIFITTSTRNEGMRNTSGVVIAVLMWIIGYLLIDTYADQTVPNVMFSLGAEVIGGIVVVGLGLILVFFQFDWRLQANFNNSRALLAGAVYVSVLLLISLILFAYAEQTKVRDPLDVFSQRIAACLCVEVFAGALFNMGFLLLLFIPVSLDLLIDSDVNNAMINITGLGIFAIAAIFTLYHLPDTVYTATFPRDLGITMLGVVLSGFLSNLWESLNPEIRRSVSVFAIFSIALIGIAAVISISARITDTLQLSMATELFGVAIVLTLTSDHLFSRSARGKRNYALINDL